MHMKGWFWFFEKWWYRPRWYRPQIKTVIITLATQHATIATHEIGLWLLWSLHYGLWLLLNRPTSPGLYQAGHRGTAKSPLSKAPSKLKIDKILPRSKATWSESLLLLLKLWCWCHTWHLLMSGTLTDIGIDAVSFLRLGDWMSSEQD